MRRVKIPGPLLALALLTGLPVMPAVASELTIDRLFASPSLSGPLLSAIRVSPDNARITWLQGKTEDRNRRDLWEYDIATGHAHLLIDANQIVPPGQTPSAEELSRRERQRTASLTGIQDYFFASAGQSLVLPVDGQLYSVDLVKPEGSAQLLLGSGESAATDASVSPHGNFVAFIREQNLYLCDLRDRSEKALTHDGGGAISNGMAEFVAQEEMGRHTGYWWSPDERHIAFERSDASPLHAAGYPAAGGPNVRATLGVVDIASGALTWIDLGSEADIYLARVQWLPDGKTLAVQRQDRAQRRLDLLFADIDTGRSRIILTETGPAWVALNDELTFLRQSREFLWGSSRDGFLHLYLYRTDGRLERQVTAGAWNVSDFRGRSIRGVDEKHRLVYFMGNERSPVNSDLLVASLDTSHPERVRRISHEAGLHGITMAHDYSFYVDYFTSSTQPPQLSLRRSNGALQAYLLQNSADAAHPDAPYAADNSLPEFGTLRAADGQALFYQLFRPRDFDPAKRYPAIVSVYGGPGVQTVLDRWNGDSFMQILTRAGYVVFQLDNRGSAFRGTAFESMLSGQLGTTEVADQVQGARWLGAQSFVDPQRIGVWGWSYGGYMTLMLMFRAPEVFRAGVAGAPVTDWSLYDTHYTERYLGTPQDNPAGYAASSVLAYAGNLQGKLLIIHGMADDNVLFTHSARLFHRLQELDKPFEQLVFLGAKHALIRQNEGRDALKAVLDFFTDAMGPG